MGSNASKPRLIRIKELPQIAPSKTIMNKGSQVFFIWQINLIPSAGYWKKLHNADISTQLACQY
jgi:hypothetical protein